MHSQTLTKTRNPWLCRAVGTNRHPLNTLGQVILLEYYSAIKNHVF